MKFLKRCLATCLFCLLAFPAAAAQNILIVGDSISAAFGLEIEQGWVALLQERLREQGYPHQVVNASVSGDTTAGGRARLPALLDKHQPELVVIELGGNDGLRGLPPTQMKQNLSAMVSKARDAGADVVLLGMRIPPNYGVRYTRAFEQVFADIQGEQNIPLMPFFLADVAEVADLMQSDRIHPTAKAQPTLLENAWPLIKAWLDQQ
ncbi:MAG: arylesterase [Pseudomonas profundi]|uniref:arylesterase n=1 Tax=Pseudomonas profundi TaxID=1981513 RepID=UPI00300201B0